MRVYVGMDVHRKRSQVALVDEHGSQLLNRNLSNHSAELTSILGRLAPGTPVAFEAAYGWGWLAELLHELELEPHLVHPSRCKAIASARLKDDRVDARTLAQLLRAELLPEAWIAPQAIRDQRAMLRHRAALVRMATALKCRVHAILADRGVSVEEPLWGPTGRVVLAELALPAVQRAIVTDCLALIDAISPLVARLERDLLTRTRPDPRVQALQALPGIGPITAMTWWPRSATSVASRPPASCAPGPGSPRRCVTPTARSATATSPRWARPGSGSSSRRPPSEPRPVRRLLPSMPRPPPAGASTSPPWRSLASFLVAASMCSPSWRPLPEKVKLPGALAPSHVPERRPKD
jgi:transposase